MGGDCWLVVTSVCQLSCSVCGSFSHRARASGPTLVISADAETVDAEALSSPSPRREVMKRGIDCLCAYAPLCTISKLGTELGVWLLGFCIRFENIYIQAS